MTPLARVLAACSLACSAALLASCGTAVDVGPPPATDESLLDTDVATALRELTARAAEAPDDAERRGELGLALEANALVAGAGTAYEQAACLAPGDARWAYHRARIHAEQGDLDRALAEVQRAIELDGSYAPARRQRGEWLLELGRMAEAEQAFREAIEVDAGDFGARCGLARVYLQSGAEARAEPILLQLVERAPDEPYLRRLLATTYRQLGRDDEARAEFERAKLAQEPHWPDPWKEALYRYRVGYAAEFKQAMRLIGARRFDAAIPVLEGLKARQPDDVTLLINLGGAYVDAGRVDPALEVLERAAALEPDHFGVHLNLSRAYEGKRQFDRALEHADRAIAANPMLAAAHLRRGLLLARMERTSEAIESLETASRYDARKSESLVWIGWLQLELQRYGEAGASFDSALAREPNQPRALLGLALARAETGDAAAARSLLQQAEHLNPRDPQLPRVRRRVAQL